MSSLEKKLKQLEEEKALLSQELQNSLSLSDEVRASVELKFVEAEDRARELQDKVRFSEIGLCALVDPV